MRGLHSRRRASTGTLQDPLNPPESVETVGGGCAKIFPLGHPNKCRHFELLTNTREGPRHDKQDTL